jgi:hypothetical protein
MKLNQSAVWMLAWLTFACGPGVQQPTPDRGSASVLVIDDATLAQLAGRSVLDVITLRMPQVRASGTPGGCPDVVLRGVDRVMGGSNPEVYVDHTHVLDTCPLSTLFAADVQRVEIYPLGVTRRPGYPTAAHGLVLVFTRGSRAQ